MKVQEIMGCPTVYMYQEISVL